MSDVVSSLPRPNRSLLAALACFAIAGLANAPLAATPRAVLALSATVGGVYAVARYARRADRLRLVRTALRLWTVVLAVVAIATVGGAAGYGSASAGVGGAVLGIATWAALLAAGAATAFLGFREYGSWVGEPAAVDADYRTR